MTGIADSMLIKETDGWYRDRMLIKGITQPSTQLSVSVFYMCMYVNLLQFPRTFFYKQCTVIEENAEMKGYSRLGQVQARVRLGQGQVRLGQVRLGQVRLGQVRLGQVRLGQTQPSTQPSVLIMYMCTYVYLLQSPRLFSSKQCNRRNS